MNIFDEEEDILPVDFKLESNSEITLKYEPRQVQRDMMDFCIKSIKDNKKFIMLESATGSGKSMFACMLMKWYKDNYNQSATFDVLTNSKALQEQYTSDFEFMNSLWGKDSYQCDTFNCSCSTGKEMGNITNKSCDDCPYDNAKQNFFNGEVSLTNFHMFLTYKLYLPQAWKRTSRLLIIDEANYLEEIFSDFITTKISRVQLRKSNVNDNVIDAILKLANTVDTIQDYADIITNNVIPAVKSGRVLIKKDINGGALIDNDLKKAIEQISYIDGLITKWEMFLDEFKENPNNWVMERNEFESFEKATKGKQSIKTKEIETVVTPVWANPYLDKMIWKHYDHVVFMSGTLLDEKMFAWMNGVDTDLSSFISIPSSFPVKNRPIYYIKCGKMSYKDKVTTFENMLPTLKNIMKRHINDKGIIFSVSYELRNWTQNGLQDNRLLVHESANKQEVLDMHYITERPTVLCSPSMVNGIDLHSDRSRFQVILKMPYPNMKSEKVKKRMETNSDWYSWKTVCDLIQSYGRSIRNETDTADTYILDSCFSDILKYSSKMIPMYVREAITHVS